MDQSFSKLYEVIKTLIAPDGCPWDSIQTPQSMKKYLVEESFEALEAITDKKSIFPAYHMNKKYWITVLLTAVTDFEKLCELTKKSFALVQK